MSTDYPALEFNESLTQDSNMTLLTLITPSPGTDATMRLKWPLLPLKISLSLFGVLCNTFVFIGLTGERRRMRAPDLLLLNLTTWDTVFLSSKTCQHIMRVGYPLCSEISTCSVLFVFYLLLSYTARMAFITSMISTIPIALERCHYCFMMVKVSAFSKQKRTKWIICALIFVSLVFSIPEFLTVVCLYDVYPSSISGADRSSTWSLCTVNSFDYVVQCGQLLRLTLKIVAWITLLILDSLLIYRLIHGARVARRMHGECRYPIRFARSFNEHSLTVAVVSVVLMALVAYPVTGIIWALTYTNTGWSGLVDPKAITDIQEAGRIVQLIYASSNLFFLLMFGARFRKNLFHRMGARISGSRQDTVHYM